MNALLSRHAPLTLLLTLLLAVAGCNSDSAERGAGAGVDPRFATAEALVEHFNSLNTLMPPNVPELLVLYHLENEFQRDQWKVWNLMTDERLYQLDCLMYEQFGETLDEFEYERRPCTPAVLQIVAEQRAEGTYRDHRGIERPLHLIKVGDRWWVSGYTIEYEISESYRHEREQGAKAMLELMSTSEEIETQFVTLIIERVRRKEFANADDVRVEYIKALQASIEAIRE